MKLIKRNEYLQKIVNVIGTPDIKVITGVRRSGKSKLLEAFRDYVIENIPNANVIHINFNLAKFEEYKDYHAGAVSHERICQPFREEGDRGEGCGRRRSEGGKEGRAGRESGEDCTRRGLADYIRSACRCRSSQRRRKRETGAADRNGCRADEIRCGTGRASDFCHGEERRTAEPDGENENRRMKTEQAEFGVRLVFL